MTDIARLALDRLEIMEVANCFENTFDDRNLDAHMTTWVDDLEFVSPFGHFTTTDDYRAWANGFLEFAAGYGGTRHLITGHEIQLDGDTATMRCNLVVLARDGSTIDNVATPHAAIAGTSQFDDELIRDDGKWKFKKRTLTTDQTYE